MEDIAEISDFVLLQKSARFEGFLRPSVPANISKLGAWLGVIEGPGIAGFVDPISLIWRTTGASSEILKSLLNNMQFRDAGADAGVSIELNVTVLERNDSKVDIAVEIYCSFQTAYSEYLNRYHPVRSLYQDMVVFAIKPSDAGQLKANHSISVPKTDMHQVNYSNTTNWSTKLGFSGGADKSGPKLGVAGDVGYGFSVTAGTATQDFDIVKTSEAQSETLSWKSQMRNIYRTGTNTPDAGGYNPASPNSIVVNGLFTKWLKDPPAAAKSDYELRYLAAYTCAEPDIKNQTIELEFSTTQQLMHAEVVGRWGIPGLEVGGTAAVIPYYLFAKGKLKIDIPKQMIDIIKVSCVGYDYKQQAVKSKLLSG